MTHDKDLDDKVAGAFIKDMDSFQEHQPDSKMPERTGKKRKSFIAVICAFVLGVSIGGYYFSNKPDYKDPDEQSSVVPIQKSPSSAGTPVEYHSGGGTPIGSSPSLYRPITSGEPQGPSPPERITGSHGWSFEKDEDKPEPKKEKPVTTAFPQYKGLISSVNITADSYPLALQRLHDSCRNDDDCIQPKINIRGETRYRPLSFAELIELMVTKYKQMQKTLPGNDWDSLDKLFEIIDIEANTSSAFIFRGDANGYTDEFKVIPVCEQLLRLEENYSDGLAYAPYDSFSGRTFLSSDLPQAGMSFSSAENYPLFLELMQNKREMWREFVKIVYDQYSRRGSASDGFPVLALSEMEEADHIKPVRYEGKLIIGVYGLPLTNDATFLKVQKN